MHNWASSCISYIFTETSEVMRKIDRRIVIVFTLFVTVGLAYGLMRYLISLKEPPPVRQPVAMKRFVKVQPVAYSDLLSPVEAPGRLSSVAEVDMVAEASGRILQGDVILKKGARFNQGDVLFVIYQDEASLALKARKSSFLNLLANILPDIRIDYPEHESAFRSFFESVSVDKPMPSFPEHSDGKLKVFLASRGVLSDYFTIIKDELQLSRYVVKAPFKGTFNQVYLEVGAYTNAGGRVARAIRTDEMELEVPVERFDAEWIRTGDRVTVHSDSRDLDWTGTVVRKSQFVDPNTQSQTVFVRLNNHSGNELLAGEYLRAQFPGRMIDDAMEIPRNAVFNSNEVFVVRDGRLERERLQIVKVNERTLIFRGLNEGDLLVVQPLINVQEGVEVDWEGNPNQQPAQGGPGARGAQQVTGQSDQKKLENREQTKSK